MTTTTTATVPGGRNPSTYPMPRPANDHRFTFTLIREVADAVGRAGYPPLGGEDLVRLEKVLFAFLHGFSSERPQVRGGDVAGPACRVCRRPVIFTGKAWRHLEAADHAAVPARTTGGAA